MQNLQNYFKVLFLEANISDDNFLKFALDSQGRFRANNENSEYTTIIDATKPLLDNYSKAIAMEDNYFTQQQGSTIIVNDLISKFKGEVSRTEGLIAYHFGEASAAYQEFYPLGITEYTRANKSNIETLMARFIVKAEKYSNTLGNLVLQTFTDVRNDYIRARREQLENIGRVTAAKSETQENREKLAFQVTSNLLVIANKFLGNPERGLDFFKQDLIQRRTSTSRSTEFFDGTIAADLSQTIITDLKSKSIFKISNLGNAMLRFCISDTENIPCHNNGITIVAGDSISASLRELNPEGGTLLNVTNLSDTEAGIFSVELIV